MVFTRKLVVSKKSPIISVLYKYQTNDGKIILDYSQKSDNLESLNYLDTCCSSDDPRPLKTIRCVGACVGGGVGDLANGSNGDFYGGLASYDDFRVSDLITKISSPFFLK